VQFRVQLSPPESPDHKYPWVEKRVTCTRAYPLTRWPLCSDFIQFIDLPGYPFILCVLEEPGQRSRYSDWLRARRPRG
jgi:hypothetical protein